MFGRSLIGLGKPVGVANMGHIAHMTRMARISSSLGLPACRQAIRPNYAFQSMRGFSRQAVFTKLTAPRRPTLLSPSSLVPRCSRSYSDLPDSAHIKRRFLDLSRTLVRLIALFYGSIALLYVSTYVYLAYKSRDSLLTYPSLSLFSKILVRGAVFLEEQQGKLSEARRFHEVILDTLEGKKRGEKTAESSGDLTEKQQLIAQHADDIPWLAAYSDALIRWGLLTRDIGDPEEAKKAFEYLTLARSIPYGDVRLKSRAALALGDECQAQGDSRGAEWFYRLAVGYLVQVNDYLTATGMGNRKTVRTDGMQKLKDTLPELPELVVPEGENISRSSFNALRHLARFYAGQEKKFSSALPIFLSLLRFVEAAKENPAAKFTIEPFDEGILRSDIAEVMWALGRREEAVGWAERAYSVCYPTSRSNADCANCALLAIDNARRMLLAMGRDEQAEHCAELAAKVVVPSVRTSPLDFFVNMVQS